jgi:ferredoxin
VQKAIEKTKKELTADFEKQIAELDTKHKEALEKARTEEAETVMDHLTSVLLDLDLSNPPEFADSTNPTKQKEKKEDGPKAVPSEEKISKEKKTGDPLKEKIEVEEVEDVLTNDPYIDTAMCTSCNECIQKNGAVFKYNADKMAYIADPKAGSFKDIVEAAEACPVAIIHPGTPLDPAESGLEELIKRASKFN